MTTWLEDFEARLNNLVQSHGAVASSDPTQIAVDYIRGMNRLYANQAAQNKGITSIAAMQPASEHKSLLGHTLGGASWLIDKASRPLYGVEQTFNTALENSGGKDVYGPKGDTGNYFQRLGHVFQPVYETVRHPVESAQAFEQGFTKNVDNGPGDKGAPEGPFKHEGYTGFTAGAGDLGAALALDPINILGAPALKAIGKGSKLGIKAGRDLLSPKAKIAADVAANGTSKVPVGSKSAKDFLDNLSAADTPESPFTIAEPPPTFGTREFHVSPTGTTETKRVLALPGPPTKVIAGRANVGAIHEAMSKVPALKYGPKAEIAPTFKEIMENAPATKAVEATPTPVAQKAATTGKGLSSTAARIHAMYQHLLTNPESARVQVQIGPGRVTTKTVAQLQDLARRQPDQADMVASLIMNKAKQLASMSKQQIAEEFPNGLFVKMSGRTGKEAPMSGVSVDALQRLFETGNVSRHGLKRSAAVEGKAAKPLTPAQKAAEEALSQHALESMADLKTLSLRNAAGEHILVGDLLDKLGVKVNPVGSKAEQLMAAIAAKEAPKASKAASKKSVFSFEGAEKPITPAQVKKIVGLTREEKAAWIKAHPHLAKEDAQALLRVKTVSGFNKRVAELRAAKGEGGFTSIEDLERAVAEGRVNKADLADLMKLTGSKSIAGVRQKLNKMIADLAAAEKSMVDTEAIAAPKNLTSSAAERASKKVVPAEQIVSNVVNHGTDPVLTSAKEVLDPTQAALLNESMRHGILKNFIEPRDRKLYPHLTNRGVARTMGEYGKGTARHTKSWNTMAQYNAFKSLVSKNVSAHVKQAIESSGAAKISGTAGRFARGNAMYDFVMPVLRAQEKILKQQGIPPVTGNGATGYLLSMLDVIDSLPRNFVVEHLFDKTPNVGRQIMPTQFSDIGEELLNHALGKTDEQTMREQIMHILTQPIKKYDQANKEVTYSDFAKQFAKMGTRNPEGAAQMLKNAVDTFADALPEVMQKYEANTATYSLKFGEAVPKVANEAIKKVVEMFNDPHYSPGDIVEMSTKVDNLAASIAKHYGITDPWAIDAAKQTANVKLAGEGLISPEVQAEAKAASKYQTAVKAAKGSVEAENRNVSKVGVQQALSDSHAVDEMLPDTFDLGQVIEARGLIRLWRGFAPHVGNEDLRPLLTEANNATQYYATGAANVLNQVTKRYTPDIIKAAWHEIQAGTTPVDEAVKAAYDEIKPISDRVFDNNESANFFMRNGVTMNDMNKKLGKFGLSDSFAMEHPQSWTEWDPDNPLDVISKYHAVAQAALAERNTGRLISSEFGSATAKPGFVKVTGQHSRLLSIIDTSLYYPKEIAPQMKVFDEALKTFNNPVETKKWLQRYDSFFHSFKAGLTIYRPGHHIRNVVGDAWFSWIDGVNNPLVYRDAMKGMYANQGRYHDWDALVSLQEMGVTPLEAGKGSIAMRVGGKAVSITPSDAYRLAAQHGVLTDYHTIEDISGTPSVHKFLNKYSPVHGKIHNAAVNTSEAREHVVRLAHFIDVIKKGNWSSMEEAGRAAGQRVRKWHPDGSDLGEMEKATARRVFLFYSWMRKAIPLVVESAIQHPGKVLAYPKAYYAIAESQGIDLNGFGDPYPADQLFPEWIRDNMEGPITGSAGHYFAAHPGVPAADIPNQFLGSPKGFLEGVGGSITPALRVPFEIMGGNSLNTGAPILDKTDYIDQNTPGVNSIAALTNHSVSGLGQPVRSVATGNEKGGLDGLAFLNYLLGGGAQDISRPNYIKEAQFEMRDKAYKAAKKARGG